MKNRFFDILALARENAQSNPGLIGEDTDLVVERYLKGLIAEVKEVRAEIKENNEVYLVDELSDIAWDYLCILSILEERGLITGVDSIFERGYEKYNERAPAFRQGSKEMWKTIKTKQKNDLQLKHDKKYGK